MKNYLRPSTVKVDAAGRELDAAGKLVVQSSRPDLVPTGGKDPKRKPEFKNGQARNGAS